MWPAIHFVYLALLWINVLGSLGVVQAQQCDKPQRDTMTLSDEDILKNTFPDGSQVSFQCSTGYRSAEGSGTSTCTAGTWSDVTLKCQKFSCGSIPDIINGDVHYPTGNTFGDTAEFSCNDGFLLVGPKSLTCGDAGWSGRPPSCEVVRCTSAPRVANAKGPIPDTQIYDYSKVVRYTCLEDYTLNGSSTLTCSKHGNFTPTPPTCIKVLCQDPVVPNASYKSGARPPYRFKSTVVYKCNPGFTMQGIGSLTCQLDSTWAPMPVCKDDTKAPSGSTRWWQSWWFILLCSITVLIILIFLIRVILRKRKGSLPQRKQVPLEEDEAL